MATEHHGSSSNPQHYRHLALMASDDLQRDIAAEPGVARAIDLAHPAAPEEREEFERPSRRPGGCVIAPMRIIARREGRRPPGAMSLEMTVA
jgi:hypothetical protein